MRKSCFLFIIAAALISGNVSAFDNEVTHPDLTDRAIRSSKLSDYLKDTLNLPKGAGTIVEDLTLEEWIERGSSLEDEPPCRASNHFHNPLQPWLESGMSDQPWFINWRCSASEYPPGNIKSAVHWATGYTEPAPDGAKVETENEWDWDHAREHYYVYLTGKDFQGNPVASTKDQREEYFAHCLQALGQVLHLIQDMAVPAHVRNDFKSHLDRVGITWETLFKPTKWFGDKFEYFVAKHREWITGSNGGNLTEPTLTRFWDTDNYDGQNPSISLSSPLIGLAEYTNINFASKNTVFAEDLPSNDVHYNPYPRKSSTNVQKYIDGDMLPKIVIGEDNVPDTSFYIEKTGDGEILTYFVKPTYLTMPIIMLGGYSPLVFNRTFVIDDECAREYANNLLPRAIGYSAGLLDYFFRGRMEIKNAFVNIGSGLTITGIEFEVKNITPLVEAEQTIEPFDSGSLDLAYQYIPEGQEEPVFHLVPDIYTITDASDSINTQYVPLTVSFPAEGIVPAGARDFSFTLIFQGKLGTEEGAVAAQVHDFSGPGRIAFYFQPGGLGNESNIYTVLPDGSDVVPITNSSIPDSWYFSPAWSPDGTMLAFEKETCSDPDPDPYCDEEYYSRDIVVIDLASDETYPNNVLTTLEFFDPVNPPYPSLVTLPSFSPDGGHIVALASDLALFYYALVVFDVSTGDWRYINDFDFWWRKDLSGSAPAWSPQGDKIAYYIHKIPDPVTDEMVLDRDIYLINPDGTGDIRLTDDDHLNTQPAWSPDGEWIVFVSDRDGGGSTDIWIMDRSGGNLQKICDCDPGCWSPTFSPDRSRIAFEQDGDTHTVNLSGSCLTQITTSGYVTSSPAWSPFLPEPSEP